MLFDLFCHANSAFVLVGLPQPVACGVSFAPPLLNNGNPVDVLPQLSVLDQIKHATCVAKFIQYMCLVLLRILQQTSATSSRVSVPWSHASI